MPQSYDIAIVGAGIVGLALARHLLLADPSRRLVVLEKEDTLGCHASGRNSGVLHSGVYYAADSLKARFCAEGNRALKAYAVERGIRLAETGKVIVAQTPAHVQELLSLHQRAGVNGVRSELLDEEGLRRVEPHARTVEHALFLPDTASVDAKAVLHAMAEDVRRLGGRLSLGSPVTRVDDRRGTLTTAAEAISYGRLVNAAGVHADRLAHQCGVGRDLAILPFKGLYGRLSPEKSHLVRGHIYPTPDLNMPFLGVHLSRTVSGVVLVGPTATPALSRENYGLVEGVRLGELPAIGGRLLSLLRANLGGFRAMALDEIAKYSGRRLLRDVRRLCPEVGPGDVRPGYKVGIRAQLVDTRARRLVMDFVLREGERSVHVLNAISPAFTCCLPLAAHIAGAAKLA